MKHLPKGFGLFILLFGVLLFSAHPQTIQAELENAQRVIAPSDWVAAAEPTIWLWHDYGSFALYAVAQETAARPAFLAQPDVRLIDETWDWLLLGDQILDTQAALPSTIVNRPAPHETMLQLVQFVGPIKEEWLEVVQATGAMLIHYVPHNGYLLWADESARQALAHLVEDGRFLQFSTPYLPTYKSQEALRTEPTATPLTLTVQMIRHAQQRETEHLVQELNLISQTSWTPILAFQNAHVIVNPQDLATILAQPDVVWVESTVAPELLDELQAQILAGQLNDDLSVPTGAGYLAWLESFGLSQNPEDYPIIDIVDDGVGIGEGNSGDYSLHQLGDLTAASRVAYINNCTAGSPVGRDGHGHLNASIAVGYDTQAGFPFRDDNGYQYGLGINPFGRVASTKIFNDDGFFDLSGCDDSFVELIQRTALKGAQISNNSWGCAACSGLYDLSSQAYDMGVRDANREQEGNQETTYIFGAGNSGPTEDSILSPGNSKNVITVGASESYRPEVRDGCGFPEDFADNAQDLAIFSSLGPAPGNRIKPELLAPGSHIIGTASPTPDFTAAATCGYYPADQTTFVSSSGTSHATPAVSGLASIYYHWLEKTYALQATPALIKAYLIAHPTYLTGERANDTLPSNGQGYGMPNLELGLDNAEKQLVNQSVVFDETGETWTLTGAVSDPNRPLRLVLAYTDQPGMVGTRPQVNDLSLQLELNGDTYWGNQFAGQWSIAGGSADADNNYEAIFLPAGTGGTFTVTVVAHHIAGNGVPQYGDDTDQDFSLVCYNCAAQPDFELTAVTAPDQAICQTAPMASFIIGSRALAEFDEEVTLTLENLPTSLTYTLNPPRIVPGEESILTISGLPNTVTGDYKLRLVGTAASQTKSLPLWLHLASQAPAAIGLTQPANQAEAVAVNPRFSWQVVPTSEAYTLQVATDPEMSNIVYEAVELGGSHHYDASLTRLETDAVYYWRVQAENSCGETTSVVQTFQTAETLPILLIDDDWGTLMMSVGLGVNVETAYATAVNHRGTYFDYWNVESIFSEPDAATFAQYDALIWFSGDAYFPFGNPIAGPDDSSEQLLPAYLEAGGCLLLSSQEYYYDRGEEITPFMAASLGISAVEDDAGATSITAVAPILEQIGTIPIDGAPRTLFADPDLVYPTKQAVVAFVRADGESVGIYIDEADKVIYLGFDLFDIEPLPRLLLIEAFMQWCAGESSTPIPTTPSYNLYIPIAAQDS